MNRTSAAEMSTQVNDADSMFDCLSVGLLVEISSKLLQEKLMNSSSLTERPGNPVARRRCRSTKRRSDDKALVFRAGQAIVSAV